MSDLVPGTGLYSGEHCPSCGQLVHLYRRSLSSGPARVMIAMYRHNQGREWIYLTTLMNELENHHRIGGYGTLGHWWGLIERRPGDRDDGSWRNGWWRLTSSGRLFVMGRSFVRKTALVYNQQCFGHEGPWWSIFNALGKRFDYGELMES